MRLKIHQHRPIVINIVLFLFFSLPCLFIAECFQKNTTSINLNFFLDFLLINKALITLVTITSFCIFYAKKISKLLLGISLITFLYHLTQLLLLDYNRVVFLMFLVYLLFSLFLIIFWFNELRGAIYNPLIELDNVHQLPQLIIPVEIAINPSPSSIQGVLANWDTNGVFILLKNREDFKKLQQNIRCQKSNKVMFFIKFAAKKFPLEGSLASSQAEINGIGVITKELTTKEDTVNWNKLYATFTDMAYLPEYWK
ncbi:MAG: hypothetical protein HQK53_15565 [Oligoflexia bacterium]|nr:hypothetical protein [Oligoflexia bacterium]